MYHSIVDVVAYANTFEKRSILLIVLKLLRGVDTSKVAHFHY